MLVTMSGAKMFVIAWICGTVLHKNLATVHVPLLCQNFGYFGSSFSILNYLRVLWEVIRVTRLGDFLLIGLLLRFQKWFVVDVLVFQIELCCRYLLAFFDLATFWAIIWKKIGDFFLIFWSPWRWYCSIQSTHRVIIGNLLATKWAKHCFKLLILLPPVYTNSQNQTRLHKIRQKDRNFPIFFGRTTKIGPILAVRVNEGLHLQTKFFVLAI